MHVEQAQFVFAMNNVPQHRYEFRCGDVFQALSGETAKFDIVLCLGLFYHIGKHMNLLEVVSALNTDLLIIDTKLSSRRGSALEISHESLDEPRNACDYELTMVPTRVAVCDMVRQFGYRCVILRPDFSDYSGAHDFRTGRRRAFVCTKQTCLDGLSVELEDVSEASGDQPYVNERVGAISEG